MRRNFNRNFFFWNHSLVSTQTHYSSIILLMTHAKFFSDIGTLLSRVLRKSFHVPHCCPKYTSTRLHPRALLVGCCCCHWGILYTLHWHHTSDYMTLERSAIWCIDKFFSPTNEESIQRWLLKANDVGTHIWTHPTVLHACGAKGFLLEGLITNSKVEAGGDKADGATVGKDAG